MIHCSSKAEAEQLLEKLKARMQEYELELHSEKTKIVYCKSYQRKEEYEKISFDFLSYSFQPRKMRDKFGRGNKTFMVYSPAMSNKAKVGVRAGIKELLIRRWATQRIEWFAEKLNPKIRGWINYYARFNKHEAFQVFSYLNGLLRKWIKNKYKLKSAKAVYVKYKSIQEGQPNLFYHWQLGIRS
ncbi:MAG: hypothetical protein KF862_26410 [Chitinophagaceae bacterium]|nr:hypothetical protein [Chitinophagaceae bacterium]